MTSPKFLGCFNQDFFIYNQLLKDVYINAVILETSAFEYMSYQFNSFFWHGTPLRRTITFTSISILPDLKI